MDRAFSLRPEQRKNVVAGLQTQTRTPCKDQTAKSYQWVDDTEVYPNDGTRYTGWAKDNGFSFLVPTKAPCQVGDRRYLQEPYQIEMSHNETWEIDGLYEDDVHFSVALTQKEWYKFNARKFPYRKTSGRFMYKSLARHWFEVTGVRAEQVQDISWKDCKAEGVVMKFCGLIGSKTRLGQTRSLKIGFQTLWDSIYGEGAWDRNDWVWAITFRKVEDGK